jgi:glycosyltransferase involved in cell wall biosynthesis
VTAPRKHHNLPISVLYNPIDDDLKPDTTAWQPEKLLFMSSPQKGLPYTLKHFEQLRQHFPEYQLFVSNPGYNHTTIALPEQVHFLGTLAHHQVIQHLRESFCVFYPQPERLETFGLVYAEANAVGTPVLAHDGGAASEVLSTSQQLVNGHHFSTVLNKIHEWRAQRPVVQAQEQFRLAQVTAAWLGLLN